MAPMKQRSTLPEGRQNYLLSLLDSSAAAWGGGGGWGTQKTKHRCQYRSFLLDLVISSLLLSK